MNKIVFGDLFDLFISPKCWKRTVNYGILKNPMLHYLGQMRIIIPSLREFLMEG